eukprot:GDKJ01014590.1.p1 GENE.GDKJ01014590.1~~GDKJ01014590.1.p1  ORF type:complete len:260 (+),score=21.87 GDKJ01014590.1:41-820(+)
MFMKSSRKPLLAALAAVAAATLATGSICATTDYIPAFEGLLAVVNNNVTEQVWWFISPTSPIAAPACNVSGYISQYDDNFQCLGVSPYFISTIATENGCIYGYTDYATQNVQLTIYCDPDREWLAVSEEVTLTTSGDMSLYTLNAYYSGVCSPTPITNATDANDTTEDNSSTVQPSNSPTATPDPMFQFGLSYTGPIWILIYVAIGALVGSVIVFLVILSFIALRKRRNGYECIDEDKKAAPLPVNHEVSWCEGQSLNA